MRIALLNLQYDNNYGGNLQRFALMKVLQNLGHDVTHINLRFNYNPQPWYRKIIRFPRRILYKLIKDWGASVFPEYHKQKQYEQQCEITDAFYYRYIKHTKKICYKKELYKQLGYDLYIVGSDQVWRKKIAEIYGIDTFFFDFLPQYCNRIAYGVSFGTDSNELTDADIKRLSPLYEHFKAVSVREPSGLQLIDSYGWNKQKVDWVVDPTLLLDRNDYKKLITDGETIKPKGNMFCYILDDTEDKQELIRTEAQKRHLKPFCLGLSEPAPIEQWLRNFSDSEFVITDSYHGLVFSIIFNKPFILIRNQFRGNTRFDAIFELCDLHSDDGSNLDWHAVNEKIAQKRDFSIQWIKNAINDLQITQ